jgi:hypothetical protein
MNHSRRTTSHRPRQRVFVFDREALSKAVHGDREMVALIRTAPRLDQGPLHDRDSSGTSRWSGLGVDVPVRAGGKRSAGTVSVIM